jgi:membrane protein required for colicin V production
MESFPLQGYDILMLLVLVGTTVFGAWKGMAWQLASLASVVLSTMVAIHGSGSLAPHISAKEPWNRFLAMLILFLATSLAVWLVFRLVARVIDRVRLKEFDRQVGALFGLAKGVLLCVVITFFVVTLSETARQSVLGSRSGRYIALLTKSATPILPEEVTRVLGQYIDELDRKLDPDTPPAEPVERAVTDKPDGGEDKIGGEIRDAVNDLREGIHNRIGDAAEDLQRGVHERADDLTDDLRREVDNQISPHREGAGPEGDPDDLLQGRGGGDWWKR